MVCKYAWVSVYIPRDFGTASLAEVFLGAHVVYPALMINKMLMLSYSALKS